MKSVVLTQSKRGACIKKSRLGIRRYGYSCERWRRMETVYFVRSQIKSMVTRYGLVIHCLQQICTNTDN